MLTVPFPKLAWRPRVEIKKVNLRQPTWNLCPLCRGLALAVEVVVKLACRVDLAALQLGSLGDRLFLVLSFSKQYMFVCKEVRFCQQPDYQYHRLTCPHENSWEKVDMRNNFRRKRE